MSYRFCSSMHSYGSSIFASREKYGVLPISFPLLSFTNFLSPHQQERSSIQRTWSYSRTIPHTANHGPRYLSDCSTICYGNDALISASDGKECQLPLSRGKHCKLICCVVDFNSKCFIKSVKLAIYALITISLKNFGDFNISY